MHLLGALINSGFNMIYPFGVQLPHLEGMFLRIMDVGWTLYFENCSINGAASMLNLCLAWSKYQAFTKDDAFDFSITETSMNLPLSFTDSFSPVWIFNLYCLPK